MSFLPKSARKLLVFLGCLCPALAAQALPVFSFPFQLEVQEGDVGHTDVQVAWSLSEASTQPVGFTWRTITSSERQTPGIDFIEVAPTRVTIPAGETSGQVTVRILGDTHYDGCCGGIEVEFSDLEGARIDRPEIFGSITRINIRDDDPALFVGNRASDDYFQVIVNGAASLDLWLNDGYYWIDEQPSTRIVQEARHGTVRPSPNWAGRIDAGTYRYTPDADFSGRDSFRYSLCNFFGCTEATVLIDVKAFPAIPALGGDRSGRQRVGMESLPTLPQASFTPSGLSAPHVYSLGLQPDPTPREPWNADSNMDWVARTLPASPGGETIEYRVLAGTQDNWKHRVDVYVGVDADGDGAPSLAEKRCAGTGRERQNEYCEMVVHVGQVPVTYWVAAHSLNGDYVPVNLDVFEVPMDRPDGSLTATGPGHASARSQVHAEVSWRDDTLLPGDRRVGFIRVRSNPETIVGDFTFWIVDSSDQMGLPLTVDEPRTFDIAAGARLDRVFIDVPEGATRLDVTSNSDDGMDFHLVRHAGSDDLQESTIAAAPDPDAGAVASTGTGAMRWVSVEGAALQPGRWYIVPQNQSQARASVTLSASIQAVAPLVRSGSYYNPGRPGSGLMLYPAGDQRVGLWYTYEAISFRPTWYYLQAPQPDATGIWRSPIYRQARAGGVSRPTQVGQATMTPMGPDVFAFTYTLNGETGSEIYSSLGRGCPSLYGQPLDASSHWFNPLRDGSGYSAQFWRNYEFFAMFDYDQQGSPLHLTAERAGFAGESGLLPLQRLMGACPSCDYVTPTRQPAGVLHRILRNGGVERLQVDADYEESWPFASANPVWSIIDRVQLLGGQGTTQGCAP